MKVEYLVPCDYAADYSGKLTLVGIFDSLRAASTPVIHPQMCIATRMRFEESEVGPRTARVTLRDADGRDVFPPIVMNITVPEPNLETGHTVVNLIVHAQSLKFESLGDYSLDLSLDETHLASTPLVLRAAKSG